MSSLSTHTPEHILEAKKKAVIHSDIDRWLKSVDSLAKELRSLQDVKKKAQDRMDRIELKNKSIPLPAKEKEEEKKKKKDEPEKPERNPASDKRRVGQATDLGGIRTKPIKNVRPKPQRKSNDKLE